MRYKKEVEREEDWCTGGEHQDSNTTAGNAEAFPTSCDCTQLILP